MILNKKMNLLMINQNQNKNILKMINKINNN